MSNTQIQIYICGCAENIIELNVLKYLIIDKNTAMNLHYSAIISSVL